MGKRPTIFRNANYNVNPPRRQYIPIKSKYENIHEDKYKNKYQEEQLTSNNQRFFGNIPEEEQGTSNNQRLFRNNIDYTIKNNNDKIINKNNTASNYFYNLRRNDNIDIIWQTNYIKDKNNIINYRSKNFLGFSNKEIRSEKNETFNERFNRNKEKRSIPLNKRDKLENTDNIDNNRPIEKINYNCIKYLWYSIPCGKVDNKIDYYENFRSKLISEEGIIKNYLQVYKLLELNNIYKKNEFLKKD